MTMIRPDGLNKSNMSLTSRVSDTEHWTFGLHRGSNLILFKVPTFDLFVITSRKHVSMFAADSKACKSTFFTYFFYFDKWSKFIKIKGCTEEHKKYTTETPKVKEKKKSTELSSNPPGSISQNKVTPPKNHIKLVMSFPLSPMKQYKIPAHCTANPISYLPATIRICPTIRSPFISISAYASGHS